MRLGLALVVFDLALQAANLELHLVELALGLVARGGVLLKQEFEFPAAPLARRDVLPKFVNLAIVQDEIDEGAGIDSRDH